MEGRRSVLFLAATELWERFTYYGLRALLVLFLIAPLDSGGFGLADAHAAAIYGLFAASAYLSALPGGWIADRYLGPVRAIWTGGCCIIAGNVVLVVAAGLPQFACGLALIAAGVGLLKTSTTSLVASAAARESMSSDSAFTIFYVAINIGGVLGPLVSAALAARTGWRGGFAVSAVGMALGLACFATIARNVPGEVDRRRRLDWRVLTAVPAVLLLLFWASTQFAAGELLQGVLYVAVGAAFVGFAYLFKVSRTSTERQRVGLMLALFCGATIFWAAGEQAAVTLTLLAARYTDRHVGGHEFPAAWYQAIYPLYVVVFAPLFVWVWQRLAAVGREPANIWKFGAGLLVASGGIVIAAAAAQAARSGMIGFQWLVGTYWLLALGEILISPVGLAAGTRLAPSGHVGFSTGLWYLSLSLGGLLAGLTGGVFDISTAQGLAATFTSLSAALVLVGIFFLLAAAFMARRLPALLNPGVAPSSEESS